MDLYIIRHAWAGHYGDPEWPDDSQRPLTDEGRERFAAMIAKLAQRGFTPELIATSPMARCRQTAEIIADECPGDPEIVELDELLPGGDLEALMDWTRRRAKSQKQIAWCGHAPDVGRLLAGVISETHCWIRFAKGAVARVRFPGPPHPGEGELRWMVTAKLLGCEPPGDS